MLTFTLAIVPRAGLTPDSGGEAGPAVQLPRAAVREVSNAWHDAIVVRDG